MSGCIALNNIKMESDGGGDGYYIQYRLTVKRYDGRGSFFTTGNNQRVEKNDSGVIITRERCFMADIQCNYNPDGTVTSAYQPSSPNALDAHDESSLTFAMDRIDCGDGTGNEQAVVYVTEPVCFRTSIETTWHKNIRLSTTHCWATSSPDPTYNVYDLFTMSAKDDDTVLALCDGSFDNDGSYTDAFQVDAFRYQNDSVPEMNDRDSYGQTMYVHCDVNACDSLDSSSTDCAATIFDIGCGAGRRARRALSGNAGLLSKLSRSRVVSKAIVLPARDKMNFVKEEPRASYNLLSDTLSLGLFAVGCVFGVVALGLFIVTKRQMNQMKYTTLTNE